MAQLPRPSDHAGTGFEPQNGGNNVEKHESDVTCNVRNGQWLHFLVVVALAFQPRPEVSKLESKLDWTPSPNSAPVTIYGLEHRFSVTIGVSVIIGFLTLDNDMYMIMIMIVIEKSEATRAFTN